MDAFVLLLAQDIDPTAIGDKLGQAQDVQQVLGIVIGVLILVVLALVTWYLRERKTWGEEKATLITDHSKEMAELVGRWSEAKIRWEAERTKHAEVQLRTKDQAAKEKEALMREMLDLVLKVERALKALTELRREANNG